MLDNGELVLAQVPREGIDHDGLRPGDLLHVASRQARSFEPDDAI